MGFFRKTKTPFTRGANTRIKKLDDNSFKHTLLR